MANVKSIRDALATKLKAIGVTVSLPIAYENIEFDPAGAAHLKESFSPSSRRGKGLGTIAQEYTGSYTVGVFYPLGYSPHNAAVTADTVARSYNLAGVFRFTGGYVRVTNARAQEGLEMDGYYMIPVVMEWQSFLKES